VGRFDLLKCEKIYTLEKDIHCLKNMDSNVLIVVVLGRKCLLNRYKENTEKLNIKLESYKERVNREKTERWRKISELSMQGRTHAEIAVLLGVSTQTIRKTLKEIEVYKRLTVGD